MAKLIELIELTTAQIFEQMNVGEYGVVVDNPNTEYNGCVVLKDHNENVIIVSDPKTFWGKKTQVNNHLLKVRILPPGSKFTIEV
ncbi:hypothetical protein C4565_00385 [Candidatus Parcubacteria bacterium]|nr:MAG: hypothetical protein C4565_00385 [Candidatus Parcubacteria bacterium]